MKQWFLRLSKAGKIAALSVASIFGNSAGNTICRPYETNTTPAGASAQCSDGIYSFSQSRRGTRSYHGGVGNWL